MTYMTCQVKIYHPREISCDFVNLNGFPLKLGEDGRLGKGGHMANLDPTHKLEFFGVCGWIGNLRRLSIFIKYSNQPR